MGMRILILGSKEYPMGSNKGDDSIPSGGIETNLDNLASELSKYCKMLIVSRRFKGTKKYEKGGNIEVYRVPYLKGKYFRNPSFNFLSFIHSLGVMGKTDIIYSHGLIASFFGYLISKISGKPIVCRPAGVSCDQYTFPLNNILYFLMKTVYKRCDLVVFNSNGEKDNFKKILRISPKKSEIIATGIPIRKFSNKLNTKKSFGIPQKTEVIGFIGRFVKIKGIDYLIKAASLIKNSNVQFMLVGDGPQKEHIFNLVKNLKLEKNFIFTGFRHDIENVLSAIDIFVISSISEGLPTSLLEAMASCKACVVTDIGLPIRDKETGMVVPPKNPERLAQTLETLIADPNLQKRLGHRAQKYVRETCTLEKVAKRHIEIFTNLQFQHFR
jgi:glycosyltransferase involved in cell wall biosynthesis